LKYQKRFIVIGVILIAFLGCETFTSNGSDVKDSIVAKVGSKELYQSQLSQIVHEGMSKTDSAAIVDGFIHSWIKENLMVAEAEKNVAADININKLVDEYRSSLLVYNFEKRLVETRLDTIVTAEEKARYYEEHKNMYLLSHPLFKCIIARVPARSHEIPILNKTFSKSDIESIMQVARERAAFHYLDTTAYMTMEDLQSLLPEGSLKKEDLAGHSMVHKRDKDHEIFVKVLRFYDEKTIPPFDFIEGKLTKSILSERKIQLLKNYREELYHKGLADKKFEIIKFE